MQKAKENIYFKSLMWQNHKQENISKEDFCFTTFTTNCLFKFFLVGEKYKTLSYGDINEVFGFKEWKIKSMWYEKKEKCKKKPTKPNMFK